MKFRKYEFTQSEWEKQKSKVLNDDGSIKESVVASVIELGFLIEDEDKYSVDIIWQNDELSSFATYKVWPEPIGSHSFGYDIDSEYTQEYYKLFPNK